MKELEENLLVAQNHSEEELSKHEDEIRLLKENQNAQLLRMKNGSRTPAALSPRPPNTPFAGRSPRLDKTTSGEGVPLATVVRAEVLEKHVKALERAIRDVDMEMEEAVGRMNRAQVDVAQLQSDRYVDKTFSSPSLSRTLKLIPRIMVPISSRLGYEIHRVLGVRLTRLVFLQG
jgi:hypothetical protein